MKNKKSPARAKAWDSESFCSYRCLLTVRIHVVVVLLVITRGYVVHPFLVIEIPFYGLLDTLLKLERWLPTQFLLKLSRVDGITHIVTLSVCYVSDEIHVLAFLASEQTVNGVDDYLYDVDVFPFVEASDVVGLGNLALVENQVYGTGVVLNVQLVAHILALSVYRKWLAMAYIIDEQWNKLFRELVRPVVVGAVRNYARKAIGVVEGPDEMV